MEEDVSFTDISAPQSSTDLIAAALLLPSCFCLQLPCFFCESLEISSQYHSGEITKIASPSFLLFVLSFTKTFESRDFIFENHAFNLSAPDVSLGCVPGAGATCPCRALFGPAGRCCNLCPPVLIPHVTQQNKSCVSRSSPSHPSTAPKHSWLFRLGLAPLSAPAWGFALLFVGVSNVG